MSKELDIVGDESSPLVRAQSVPRRIGGPLAEVEVAGRVAVIRGADSHEEFFKPVEPAAVRVSVEVALTACPDLGDRVVGRVAETLEPEGRHRLEPALRTVEFAVMAAEEL